MKDLYDHIKTILEENEKFCKEGKLFKNNVIEASLKLDTDLLQILIKDDYAKQVFFATIDSIYVFDKVKFQKFVSNKQFLPDSFTAYKNRIGLTTNDYFLTESKDVVLDFPFKDCVLEGGQTREDQKRQEIFWNEILAADSIDKLLEPKVLSNWKRYQSSGITYNPTDISINDNFIIKGNNLIALYSLKKVYRNKIKLIYIDPPYNTENDGFRYNDSFNHSSWLTFMKNRLEVARDLLTEDGLFWISLSDKEAHYCKVLADEIFGQDNFIADVIWNSTKSVTNTAIISDAHTHNLLYAKNINITKANRTKFRLSADESKFSNPDNDPRGKWVADPFQVGGERPNQLYDIVNPKTGVVYKPNKGSSWKNEKKVFDELMKDNRIVFGTTGDAGPQRKRFWYEAKERGQVTTTLWKDLPTTTNGTQHLKSLFKEMVFNNPKPEGLIERIIELSTSEGDIVLDYHLGSGTTAAVAHKMNRRYIGIEQMDYIESVAVKRLQFVVEGERGGVSENHNWKGGGSFVYAELHNLLSEDDNFSSIIEKIRTNILLPEVELLDKLQILEEDENLSDKEKLNFLISMLDKNTIYLSKEDMNDSVYKVDDYTKTVNNLFYNS